MTEQYFNRRREPFYRIRVDNIEKQYNAVYMGAWQHEDFDMPLDVFYIRKPTMINGRLAKKYVGVFIHDGLQAADVDDIFMLPIIGAEADDGEICISCHIDDQYLSIDGSTWVEGGRENFQTNKPDRLVSVHINDDSFEFEPLGLIEYEEQPKQFGATFFGIFRP